MLNINSKPAFTMIELVFVIVIIGILSAIAIPKLAVTRDDAVIVKGKSQVAAIRSGIAMQKSKALLQGKNTDPYNSKFLLARLDNITSNADFNQSNKRLFSFGDGNESNVLESPIFSKATVTGGWVKDGNNSYVFKMPDSTDVTFTYSNGAFSCYTPPASPSTDCLLLTQ